MQPSIPHTEAHNHNGGMLAFGPDGKLYAGTGDGGNSYDSPTRDAQNPDSRLGKLLAIDTATDAVSVYALGLQRPKDGAVMVKTLNARTPNLRAAIKRIELLDGGAVLWKQTPRVLEMKLPPAGDGAMPYALRIRTS